MSATPRIAAVIVNFRTPELTLGCVESLRRLRWPALDVVVVENASGDDSAARLAAALRPGELLLAAENGGYTAGNNLGLRTALGRGAEHVLVLNPDTLVANDDFLAPLVARLAAEPRVGAVGPRVFLRTVGNVQNTVLRFPWLWRRAVDWFRVRLLGAPLRSGAEPRGADALNGVCVLFRGACLREVGLFDERTFAYIEDIDWAYRAERRGWRREYLPVDSVVHLQKESGYEPGGTVDFLLKRNTLYFLLKTRRLVQAAGYSAATLALAAVRRRPGWSGRLAVAYWRLWTGRWAACMGRP